MINPERTLYLDPDDITNVVDNSLNFRFLSDTPLFPVITSPRTGIGGVIASRSITEGKAISSFTPSEFSAEDESIISYNDVLRKGVGGSTVVTNLERRKGSVSVANIPVEDNNPYRVVRYGVHDYTGFSGKFAVDAQEDAIKDEAISKALSLDGLRTRRLIRSCQLADDVKVMTDIGFITVSRFRELTGQTPSLQDWAIRCRYRFRDLLMSLSENFNRLNDEKIILTNDAARPEKHKQRILADHPLSLIRSRMLPNNDLPLHFYENLEFLVYEIMLRAGRDDNEQVGSLAFIYLDQEEYERFLSLRVSADISNEYQEVLSIGRTLFAGKFRTLGGLQEFFAHYLDKVNILGEQAAIMHKHGAYSGDMLNDQNISLLFEIVDHDVTKLNEIRASEHRKALEQIFRPLWHLNKLLMALIFADIITETQAQLAINTFLDGFMYRLGKELESFQDQIKNWFKHGKWPVLDDQYLYKITLKRHQELSTQIEMHALSDAKEDNTLFVEYGEVKDLLDKMKERLEYCPIIGGWVRNDDIIGNGVYLYAIKYLMT